MKKKHKITIILNGLSRNSGGLSTSLDFVQVINDLDYDYNIFITSGKLRGWIQNFLLKSPIKYVRIHSMPFQNNYKLSVRSNSLIKFMGKLFLYVIEVLEPRKKIYQKIIFKSQYIFIFTLMKTDIINFTRANSSALIIYNHPGSVETYQNYWLKNLSNNISYEKYMSNFDYLLFQSKNQAKFSRNLSKKYKTFVLEPSADENKILKLSQNRIFNRDYINLVCIGSIQPRKGQDIAINVFKKLKNNNINMKLWLVGPIVDEKYKALLDKTIVSLDLSKSIFFTGFRRDYLDYINQADYIIQTSRSEGVSRILRESMLLKKTIVTFKLDGTMDLLSNNEAFLVDNFDENKFVEAIYTAIKKPKLSKIKAVNAQKKYLINNSSLVYKLKIKKMIENVFKGSH